MFPCEYLISNAEVAWFEISAGLQLSKFEITASFELEMNNIFDICIFQNYYPVKRTHLGNTSFISLYLSTSLASTISQCVSFMLLITDHFYLYVTVRQLQTAFCSITNYFLPFTFSICIRCLFHLFHILIAPVFFLYDSPLPLQMATHFVFTLHL
jgi:hypothetical protein